MYRLIKYIGQVGEVNGVMFFSYRVHASTHILYISLIIIKCALIPLICFFL